MSLAGNGWTAQFQGYNLGWLVPLQSLLTQHLLKRVLLLLLRLLLLHRYYFLIVFMQLAAVNL